MTSLLRSCLSSTQATGNPRPDPQPGISAFSACRKWLFRAVAGSRTQGIPTAPLRCNSAARRPGRSGGRTTPTPRKGLRPVARQRNPSSAIATAAGPGRCSAPRAAPTLRALDRTRPAWAWLVLRVSRGWRTPLHPLATRKCCHATSLSPGATCCGCRRARPAPGCGRAAAEPSPLTFSPGSPPVCARAHPTSR